VSLSKKLEWDLRTNVERLEDSLNLERNFLTNLTLDDDWSAVIKCHAFLEMALTHFLADFFQNEELKEIFAFLEMSDSKRGKVAFLEKLQLLRKEERQFIRELSALRNRLVHDISNVYFDLKKHVSNLDSQQRKNFIAAFSIWKLRHLFEETELTKNINKAIEDIALTKPKTAIILSVLTLVENIFDRPRDIEKMKEYEELNRKFEAMLRKLKNEIVNKQSL
jgi:hypothetical protein